MTNENNLTRKIAEEEIIEREFPYAHSSPPDYIKTHQASIQNIKHYCAISATSSSVQNSKNEQRLRTCSAILKTLWTCGLTVGTAYILNHFGQSGEIGNLATVTAVPATLFTTYQLKLNLFGKHVFTGAGTYYKSPYFSIFDELKIANGWRRIARLQKERKLSTGTKDVATRDCYLELGRNQFGGP